MEESLFHKKLRMSDVIPQSYYSSPVENINIVPFALVSFSYED